MIASASFTKLQLIHDLARAVIRGRSHQSSRTVGERGEPSLTYLISHASTGRGRQPKHATAIAPVI
jgi:hypothetical protein